ncbi:MAG: MoaD/ThiS family protein [Ectothiorhodospiraceae bacterium]|nr:MoaD/ThiS family protein [Chromatiales bacterium]MCP5156279.1 MoaD/ThiS family protein [Ectothiorhodospiraceae bacterium]
MARVVLGHELGRLAGGDKTIDVPARNVRELKAALVERYPQLAPLLASDGLAVAIDGDIVPDAFLEPLRPDSEVFFLPAIRGG